MTSYNESANSTEISNWTFASINALWFFPPYLLILLIWAVFGRLHVISKIDRKCLREFVELWLHAINFSFHILTRLSNNFSTANSQHNLLIIIIIITCVGSLSAWWNLQVSIFLFCLFAARHFLAYRCVWGTIRQRSKKCGKTIDFCYYANATILIRQKK